MIVSLRAGNVKTGAFESVDAVADIVQDENTWVHVDGAFGLWAVVRDRLRGPSFSITVLWELGRSWKEPLARYPLMRLG